MSERTKNLAIVFAGVIMALSLVGLLVTHDSPQDRVERIGSLIKCPVCQGESIADSPATMAQDMMTMVQDRVDAGLSDDEIVAELLGSFSGAVLLDPPASGSTLLLWILPVVAAAIGIVVIFWWKSHPERSPEVEEQSATPTPYRRLAGGLIVIGGFVVIVIFASGLLQERSAPNSGAAEVNVDDLDDISNDTMEAVIAANLENPEIDGMRLALAERYFTAGDYRSAFPHFLAVAQSPKADSSQATVALVRLGWMAYDGNGEVDAAIDLLDQSLEITPGSPVSLYLKGQVLWCGRGDIEAATDLFQQVLIQSDLPDETRQAVEEDLARAQSGEGCV